MQSLLNRYSVCIDDTSFSDLKNRCRKLVLENISIKYKYYNGIYCLNFTRQYEDYLYYRSIDEYVYGGGIYSKTLDEKSDIDCLPLSIKSDQSYDSLYDISRRSL